MLILFALVAGAIYILFAIWWSNNLKRFLSAPKARDKTQLEYIEKMCNRQDERATWIVFDEVLEPETDPVHYRTQVLATKLKMRRAPSAELR